MDFDDNKVFKEHLGILTFVKVCRIISLRTYEEMLEESEYELEDQTLALKITYEDSSSDGDPDSEEVNSEESHPLVTQTLKFQKPRSGLWCDQPLKSEV